MNFSDMRDRITFQKKKEQEGPIISFDEKDNYDDYKTVWAKVEYFGTKEYFSAKAENVLDTIKFIIRYRKDITPDMRILFDDTCYEVKGEPRPLDSKKMYLLVIGERITHE